MPRRAPASRRKPFQELQYRFAAHLRDPSHNAPPRGIEERRMKVYSDLFYNNVQSFLANGFPVLRRITEDGRWHAMVRDFFSRHRSRTPLFHRIAEEFLDYLENERGQEEADPPFLLELAHYEWVELALSISDKPAPPADPNGDLINGQPVMSPVAWLLSYRFPVHRISPEFQPTEPGGQATHLVVWRDRSDEIRFIEANPVTARLLQLMQERRSTGRRFLLRIARELKHPDPEAVVADGAALLHGLKERGILLGTHIKGKK